MDASTDLPHWVLTSPDLPQWALAGLYMESGGPYDRSTMEEESPIVVGWCKICGNTGPVEDSCISYSKKTGRVYKVHAGWCKNCNSFGPLENSCDTAACETVGRSYMVPGLPAAAFLAATRPDEDRTGKKGWCDVCSYDGPVDDAGGTYNKIRGPLRTDRTGETG